MTTPRHRHRFACPLLGSIPLLCLLLAACQGDGGRDRAPVAGLLGAPAWVTEGCAGSEDRICGVGRAAGMQKRALRRTAAIGRARTEVARSLRRRVVAMLQDYAAGTPDDGYLGLASGDDQHLQDLSKLITDVSLAGTEVVDTWISEDATYYALVGLELDAFADTVRRMSQLSEGVRGALLERADAAFTGDVASADAR